MLHASNVSSPPPLLTPPATFVVMVEPVSFYSNPVTAETNTYQMVSAPLVADSDAAIREHRLVATRLANEYHVDVLDISGRTNSENLSLLASHQEDTTKDGGENLPCSEGPLANKPDAVFPNNSFSMHTFSSASAHRPPLVVLYPMSPGRRDEIPECLLREWNTKASTGALTVLDLRHTCAGALEGTGAINFTHDGRAVFVSLSPRADRDVLEHRLLSTDGGGLGLSAESVTDVFVFRSTDEAGVLVYHTNVVGWTGRGICAWCWESMQFDTEKERARCESFLIHNVCGGDSKKFLTLTRAQMRHFCGNAIEVINRKGASILCMSSAAWRGYTEAQQHILLAHYGGTSHIAICDIPTIERLGGGSLRCLLAASISHHGVSAVAADAALPEGTHHTLPCGSGLRNIFFQ